MPESQISFIEFIVEPTLSILSDLIAFIVNSDNERGSSALATTKEVGGNVKQPINSNKHIVTRRAESDNSIKSENKPQVNARTPSFPLQR